MNTQETYYDKLFFSNSCGEMFFEDINEFDIVEMNQAMLAEVDNHFDRFFNMAKNLVEHKIAAARRLCRFKSNYSYWSKEISSLRYIIKYLISGLYISSYVRNHHELEILRSHWEKYRFDDCNITLDPLQLHLKAVFSEFSKVETLIDIRLFAAFFNQYVINLVFEMIDLSLLKLDSTLASFKILNSFEYFCNTLAKRRGYYVDDFRRAKLYNQLVS